MIHSFFTSFTAGLWVGIEFQRSSPKPKSLFKVRQVLGDRATRDVVWPHSNKCPSDRGRSSPCVNAMWEAVHPCPATSAQGPPLTSNLLKAHGRQRAAGRDPSLRQACEQTVTRLQLSTPWITEFIDQPQSPFTRMHLFQC